MWAAPLENNCKLTAGLIPLTSCAEINAAPVHTIWGCNLLCSLAPLWILPCSVCISCLLVYLPCHPFPQTPQSDSTGCLPLRQRDRTAEECEEKARQEHEWRGRRQRSTRESVVWHSRSHPKTAQWTHVQFMLRMVSQTNVALNTNGYAHLRSIAWSSWLVWLEDKSGSTDRIMTPQHSHTVSV